jgi:hypothetical protein
VYRGRKARKDFYEPKQLPDSKAGTPPSGEPTPRDAPTIAGPSYGLGRPRVIPTVVHRQLRRSHTAPQVTALTLGAKIQ